MLKRLQLHHESRTVRALARNRTNGEVVAGLGADPVIGDVLDLPSLAAGMEGCSIVYHVAGVNEMCGVDPDHMYRVNVAGSVNVVRAAAEVGVRRIVYTSSAATLGEARGETGNEDTAHNGDYLSDYARSKHQAELAVLAESQMRGVELVSVNPSSVQGPGRTTGSARLFLDYLNGGRRALVDTTVSIVDIDDCAEGHVLAESKGVPGERYVLSGSSVRLRDAVAMMNDITGLSSRPVFLPGWTASVGGALVEGLARLARKQPGVCKEMVRTLLHGARYDGSRATRELGLTYSPLEYTLRRTIEWYVEYGFVRRDLPAIPRRR